MEEESEKAGLKLSVHKTKIMATNPITSWQTDGETVETVRDFILGWGLKITANGDCSLEIKRCLLLGCFDPFELWCWRRLLRVSWTTRRSNQSILKEISPEYSLEGLTLKLKLQ